MTLTDQHGRRIRKLRLSLTDKCNLRCHYCMPVNQVFMSEDKYLSADEYVEIVQELQQLGLEEVRLTGGEPLMRKAFPEIVKKLGKLNLKKMSLTTNGIYLNKYLGLLKENRIFHLNISLDSLNEENFKKITLGNHLKKILKNIEQARLDGFVIKLNVVVMKGVNDHEVMDFVQYSQQTGIEVRFLELMRIGFACGPQNNQFISAQELIENIKRHHELKPATVAKDSTSFNFVTEHGAQIGFIASESQAFCGQCSRWRLSSDGMLRACLLKEDGLNVKATDRNQRVEIYQSLLGMKPLMRPHEVLHSMNMIGG